MHAVSTIREQITDSLRLQLIAGKFEFGSKLNETELAHQFHISTGTIRRVLLILCQEGLVNYKAKNGYFVTLPLEDKVKHIMLNVRFSIEEFAIKKLIAGASTYDIFAMETLLSKMTEHCKHNENIDFIKADLNFHKYFINCVGEEDLLNIWYPSVYRIQMNQGINHCNDNDIEEHTAILDAIKSKNIEAASKALKQNIM